MKAFVVGFLILICSLDLRGQKLGEVEKRLPEASAPRETVLEWSTPEGRPFWYRLPAKKDASGNLLIMLHGTGGNHGWAFWNYGVASGQFRPGDIIVSPDGLTPGGGTTFNFTQSKPDGEQIAGLIRRFTSDFEIERVYLYGHSQGAFFCYWFQGSYPELVDGVIAHAGNLLGNVPHPKLAKEKVAIAILHGRADAVVTVECAFSTEKAMKELGYQKLKLEIVEGLTAQSGHWPLPMQVNELLNWLDQICVADGGAALSVFEQALAREVVILSDLVNFESRAEQLLAKHRGSDSAALKERLVAASAELESRLQAVIEILSQLDSKLKTDSSDAALFRIVAEIIEERGAAKKALRAQLSAARSQSKTVEKCLKLLYRKVDTKSLTIAKKVLAQNLLTSKRLDLARFLESALSGDQAEIEPTLATELTAEIKAIAALDAEQRLRLQQLLAPRPPVEAQQTDPEPSKD